MIRIIVFGGLYWGLLPYLGKSPFTQPKHFWFQASTFGLECQNLNPLILNHMSQTLHPIFDKLLTQKLRTQYTPQDTTFFLGAPLGAPPSPAQRDPQFLGKTQYPYKLLCNHAVCFMSDVLFHCGFSIFE